MFAGLAGRLCLVVALAGSAFAPLSAQSAGADGRNRFALRIGGDVLRTAEQFEFLAGVSAGWYRLGTVSPEAGLSVFPRYLDEQVILMPEAGVAYPRRLGGSVALFRIGLSPYLAFPEEGASVSFAAYAGAGLVVPLGRLGVRIDTGPMLLGGANFAWALGLGLTSVPAPWR